MNYKTLIMIALALCLCLVVAPVTAVWENGNWVESSNSVNDPVTGVDSKIVPTNTDIPTDYMGELNIQTLTHHSLIGSTFTFQRVDATNHTFVNGDRVAKDIFDSYIATADIHTFELDHTGRYNDRFVPGVYRVNLLDGDGGQPEYAIVEITQDRKADVVFLGHGVSMGDTKAACLPVFTIISAEYCGEAVKEVSHAEYKYVITPAKPGVDAIYSPWSTHCPYGGIYETRIVVDKAAYTENKHYEITDTRDNGHWEGSGWNKHWVSKLEVKCNNPDHHNWHTQNFDCTKSYTVYHDAKTHNEYRYLISPAIPGKDAVISEWAMSLPDGKTAIETRNVIDTQAVLGGCADVELNVQSVVDRGIMQFLFNNAKAGIYDANGNLVSEVKDPAVNIVKHISMKYNKGCGSSDIKAEFEEYELFDITTGTIAAQPA